MQLFEHFERVYIVSLPERTDRRKAIEKELETIGYRTDGVHIRFFDAIRPDNQGDFPSIGAKGCYLSHLHILKEAIRDNLHQVLILEDDVSFSPLWHKMPAGMLDPLVTMPWHFVYPGHNETIVQSAPGLYPVTIPIATTHCYGLNQSVLQLLHDYLETCLTRPAGHPLGGAMHVDGAYSLFRKQNPQLITLIATPSLAYQRSSRSDIYPNKWYDRHVFSQYLAGVARQLKNRFRKHPVPHEQGKNA